MEHVDHLRDHLRSERRRFSRGYRKLELDFPIPKELSDAINEMVDFVNFQRDCSAEDAYRTEIDCILRYYRKRFLPEQMALLKDYYVHRGIYKERGDSYPWEQDRAVESEQRYICCQQRELYEYAQQEGADVFTFSNRFLRSTFCNRSLDQPYSVDQFADVVNWVEFLAKEGCFIEKADATKAEVTLEEAGWLGFTYRKLHFATDLPSSRLAELVPPERLLRSFHGLTSCDEEMQAEIIIQDFHLKADMNSKGDVKTGCQESF